MQLPTPEIVHEAISVVLLGTFAPAKFSAYWVGERCGLGKDLVDTAEVLVFKSQELSRLRIGPYNFTCDRERLVMAVESVALETELFDLVMAVLRTGEFSELNAIGINSESIYKLHDEDRWHRIGHTLVPKEQVWSKLTERPGMSNVEILWPKHTKLGELVESISVKPAFGNYKPGIITGCNLHYVIPQETNQHQRRPWQSASEFVDSEWEYMKRRSKIITETILREID
ncbi:MAG: hypothetical protein DVB22_002791 [Verrucomicrobia bacterium]|jgi:hypothetical protein|nr:MAG: hypothetical protein DVB22_002791 [Verrucomicrobiota bacterium]